jgi:hypothetical protein
MGARSRIVAAGFQPAAQVGGHGIPMLASSRLEACCHNSDRGITDGR